MIFRSPYPDITIPETPLTPFVLRRAEELAAKPALIDGASGRAISYQELADNIGRAAAGLAARGFRKGDVFAIFSPNLPEYAVAFHAISLLGGIVTTINPLSTAAEIAAQLRDAGAKFLLTVPSLLEKAQAAAAGAGIAELFVFGAAAGATPFARLLESEGRVPEVEINPAEDTVALPYSSGTTGISKGVMLTHRNMVANLAQLEATEHLSADDTLVCVLPLFHIYGMTVIMNYGLFMGATIVMLPRFELEQFLRVIQDYGVTHAHLVPPIVLALTKHPAVDRFDFSRLRTIFSAAAPLGVELGRACAERLDCSLLQGYGMTEASPATHMSPRQAERVREGSVGCPVSLTEARIVDTETGAELGVGQKGEICVRGPQVMKGYINRPDATAQTIDAEGWLHTGDIGYADADGHFYIVDRVKELIKYKGYQVAPAELEAILLTHPAVADAAVIPRPDEEAGEEPKAYVVLKHEATPEELMAHVAARVAPHKKIRHVEFIEQIPKTASGKILRRVLIERERAT